MNTITGLGELSRKCMKSVNFRLLIVAAILVLSAPWKTFGDPGGLGFATPQEAVTALKAALSAKDPNQLRAIFGPDVSELVNPDLVEATNEFVAVSMAINETNRVVNAGEDRALLEFGRDKTIFPVPIVKSGGRWFFDTASGKEELINRRIGRNELEALDSIRTYVQAQREYASADRDGDEVLEYAQKFASTSGQKDGLYWDPEIDGTISPLGPLVADAEAEGYRKRVDRSRRMPFHGYYFRILTKQGKNAPGGAYDYIINGNMIGGFALVAWPSDYDESGVMTFIVNQQGRVYQKDLGPRTDEIAEALKAYDPDKTWSLSPD